MWGYPTQLEASCFLIGCHGAAAPLLVRQLLRRQVSYTMLRQGLYQTARDHFVPPSTSQDFHKLVPIAAATGGIAAYDRRLSACYE